MQKFQYVTVDTILAKYHRDFKGLGINEGDAIEWIGEALGFAQVASVSEEAVAFREVKNYQCDIPIGLHFITQIARSNKWSPDNTDCCTPEYVIPEIEDCLDCEEDAVAIRGLPIDCEGRILGDQDVAYYRPYFDLQYEYLGWANSKSRHKNFSPVRLANHSFFNTLVCKEPGMEGLYQSCHDEYTIVGDQLRFSFCDGFVAVAHTRQRIDPETGYPMIPDDESAKAAITYYMAWKIKQQEAYNHREGAASLSQDAERHWIKYISQFKTKAKAPTGVDQYQNLMQGGSYLIPSRTRYENYFGNLGKPENRSFNNPRRRY